MMTAVPEARASRLSRGRENLRGPIRELGGLVKGRLKIQLGGPGQWGRQTPGPTAAPSSQLCLLQLHRPNLLSVHGHMERNNSAHTVCWKIPSSSYRLIGCPMVEKMARKTYKKRGLSVGIDKAKSQLE